MIQRRFSLAQSTFRVADRISAEEYAARRQRLVESVKKVAGQTGTVVPLLLAQHGGIAWEYLELLLRELASLLYFS